MGKQSKTATPTQDTGTGGGNDGLWHYEVPRQDAGAGAVQSNSAHYTGGAHGGDSQQGDFLASPPEANAMPAGAPQTSRGSAAGSRGSAGGSGPGAGGGEPAPVGNGTKDEPVWGS